MAVTTIPFRCTVPWESRQWQRWERTLYGGFTGKPLEAIFLLLFVLPLTLAAFPVMPILSLIGLRRPPSPRGAFDVGCADTQAFLKIKAEVVSEEMLRLRVFYPAASPSLNAAANNNAWLPPGAALGRYAAAHPMALPFPLRVRRVWQR